MIVSKWWWRRWFGGDCRVNDIVNDEGDDDHPLDHDDNVDDNEYD